MSCSVKTSLSLKMAGARPLRHWPSLTPEDQETARCHLILGSVGKLGLETKLVLLPLPSAALPGVWESDRPKVRS